MSKLTMILAVLGVIMASAGTYAGGPPPVPDLVQEQQEITRGACTTDCG
jgi:hypothetical protein